MKKQLIYILSGLGVGLVICLLLTASALFYLNTRQGQAFSQRLINRYLAGKIHWQEMHLSVFDGRIEIRKPRLAGPTGEVLAGGENLTLNWSWPALLQKEITIRGSLSKPWIHLHRERDNRFNLTKVFAPAVTPITEEKTEDALDNEDRSGFPFNLAIESFRLVEGSFQFRESTGRLATDIHGINLAVSSNLGEARADIDVDFAGGHVTFHDHRTDLKPSSLKVRYADNRLAPIHLSLSTEAGGAILTGVIADPFESPSIHLNMGMHAALEILSPGSGPSAFNGAVRAEVRVTGPADNPEADIQITYEGGTVLGQSLDRLDGRIRLSDRLVTIDRLNIAAGGGELFLNGRTDLKPVFTNGFFQPAADFKSLLVDADFSIQSPDLAASLAPFGIHTAKGALTAHGHITGTLHRPRFDLRVDGTGLAYDDIRLGNVHLAADLDSQGQLRIGEMIIDNRGSTIRGKGEIQVLTNARTFARNPPLNLELTLANVEANDFVSQKLARGHLNGTVQLEGGMQNPLGRFDLEGHGIGIGDYPVGEMQAVGKYQNGTLTMATMTLVNGDTRVRLTGNARLFAPEAFTLIENPVIDVAVTGEAIRIEDYFSQWKGRFSLDTRLSGSLKAPQGPIHIQGRQVTAPWQYFDRLDLTGRLEGDILRVDQLAASPAPDEWVRANGRISTHGLTDVRIVTEGISLGHIDFLKNRIPVEGKLAVTLAGSGPFGNPKVTGTVALKKINAGEKPLKDLLGDLNLENRSLTFNVHHGAIDLSGRYHLIEKSFSVNSRIHSDDLAGDLGPYLTRFDREKFGGRIRGEFQAEGDLDHLEQLAASGTLSDVRLDFKGREVLRTEDARLSYNNNGFRISGWDLTLLEMGTLHIEGSGQPAGEIDMTAQGDLPLAVGRVLFSRLEDLSGNLRLSAALKGKWDQPEIRGHVAVQSGALTIPAWGQKLHQINGTLTLQPDAITVHGLRGKLDEGDLNVYGTLNLDHFHPAKIDIALDVANLPFSVPESLDVFITSQLALRGTPDHSRLTGKISLTDGVYYKDFQLNPMDMLKKKRTQEKRSKPPDIDFPYLKNLDLDVEIATGNPFLAENNLAELDIVSNARILGKLTRPEVVGRTEIPEGMVRFWNRQFQITHGSIDFIDPYSTTPKIDIRAETDIRQWTVYVDVTGPVDNPNLELSSSPAMESGEILALILTGRTSREMIAGEGGQTSATGAALGALAETPLGMGVKTATGVDSLEVDTVASGGGSGEDTRVTFGKDLSDRMTLKYSMETKEGELVHKTIAEYQLLENILVSGFQDNNGIYGGALRYRIEFR